MTETDTVKSMLFGVVLAIMANISYYAWVFGEEWPWATGFPLNWLHICTSYLQIFFHEIGHTVTMWFYGYIAVPSFDFVHGGGMSWMLSDKQHMPLLMIIWLSIGYFIWFFRGEVKIQMILASVLLFHLVSFSTNFETVLISFMGHGAEPLVAALFLYRALFNLVERAPMERLMHYFIGFGILFHNFVFAAGLLQSSSYRLSYFHQKGAHGFGDFDTLANISNNFSFNNIVVLWLIMNIIMLILPFVLYGTHYVQNYAGLSDDSHKL